MRLCLPDRPGALGAVASRIGAVKGDLVGIEILDSWPGEAIDELVIRLPSAELLDLLVDEVVQVDGVSVEDVRPCTVEEPDPRLTVLEVSVALVDATSSDALLDAVETWIPTMMGARWVQVLETASASVLRASEPEDRSGESGAADRFGGIGNDGSDDVVSIDMPVAGLRLVFGRDGIPWRERERRHLGLLARIVESRWVEVSSGS